MYLVRPSYFARKWYSNGKWRIATDEKIIYLTFDDGPHSEITPWVLDILKQFNAKATFFCVGENVEKHPEVYQRIISENHSVGNHTYNHVNGWKTKNEIYFDNVKKCSELVNSKLFRPPYGKITPSQYSHLTSHYSLIMWDVLSRDFDRNTSKEKCLKNVVKYSREGSIVLFHDSEKAKKNIYYTLPKFLEHFSKNGFSFKAIN